MISKQLIVVLVGRPNVGKSTLFNRLTGKRRAIVKDQPGVTRDRQYGSVDWNGITFTALDTGGLDLDATGVLQKKVTLQSQKAIEDADLVLFMMDGKTGLTTVDREWIVYARKINKPKLFVINKIDHSNRKDSISEFYEGGISDFVTISAETGLGMSDLLDAIEVKLRGMMKQMNIPVVLDPTREGQEVLNISIIGRPNCGKSTLLNRLINEERSITHAESGTTRDPVDVTIDYQGQPFCLIDTAGIRRRGRVNSSVEKISITKTIRSIERSHLCLIMIDGIEGIADQDAHIVGEAYERNKMIMILINKWDIGQSKWSQKEFDLQIERKLGFISYCPFLYISALAGNDTDRIFAQIKRMLLQYNKRVTTSELNKEFERIIESHPLPAFSGRNLKMYYMTQISARPPTFVVFCNEPSKIHFSYKRYLVNCLRSRFQMSEVPIKLIFKKKRGLKNR